MLLGVLIPVAACVWAAPMPRAEMAGERIDALLARMQHAIALGDSAGYLSMVDPDDGVFVTEQRAWAGDFVRHPVADVTIGRAGDGGLRFLEGGDAVATIEIGWRVPGEPAGRSFVFDALFRPVGLDDGAWVYAGRAWGEVHEEHAGVRVLADGGFEGLSERIAARVPVLVSSAESILGVELGSAVEVKVYPDMASLQASIGMSYTDPLSGWNEPGESIKILGRAGLEGERLDVLLAHEIGHAVSFALGDSIIDAPWWVLEGIAEVSADEYRSNVDRRCERVEYLYREGNLRRWEQLADFRGEATNHAMHVYLQGWSMVRFVGEAFGNDARNAWLRAMGAGGTIEDATGSAVGVSFEELDARWKAMLAERAADGEHESE